MEYNKEDFDELFNCGEKILHKLEEISAEKSKEVEKLKSTCEEFDDIKRSYEELKDIKNRYENLRENLQGILNNTNC